MNEEILCSVIVPVYNVENYLPRCMDSLLQQTLKNIEIVCIDDGSTDRSGKLLDAYAEKDSRVRMVHQTNHGVAHARNMGLQLVRGKWFTYVDSDDYVVCNMLERMMAAAESNNADICICESVLPDCGYRNVSNRKIKMKDEVLTGYEVLEYINQPKSWPWITPWNKLYRTERFAHLRYPNGVQHEDQYLAHHIFINARKVVSISDTLYFLCYRENSISNSKYDIRQLDYMGALYDRMQLYKENGFKALYSGVELKALKLLLQAYWKLNDLNQLEKARLFAAEQQYLEIYQLARERKQLDILRKGVITFVKGIRHHSDL